jgi:hypothetical protein
MIQGDASPSMFIERGILNLARTGKLGRGEVIEDEVKW